MWRRGRDCTLRPSEHVPYARSNIGGPRECGERRMHGGAGWMKDSMKVER